MRSVKLQGANLRFARLQGAILRNAKMQGADLSRARLQGADLTSARLQGANLTSARLQGANLRFARLQGAILRRTKLLGANLLRVDVTGADFDGADVTTEPDWQNIFKEIESEISDPNLKRKALDRINQANRRIATNPGALRAFSVSPLVRETFIGNEPPWMKQTVKNIQAVKGSGFQVLMRDAFKLRRALLLTGIACEHGAMAAKGIAAGARLPILISNDPYLSQALLWEKDLSDGCAAVKTLDSVTVNRLRNSIIAFLIRSSPHRSAEFRQFQSNKSTRASRLIARFR